MTKNNVYDMFDKISRGVQPTVLSWIFMGALPSRLYNMYLAYFFPEKFKHFLAVVYPDQYYLDKDGHLIGRK
jgi:hypothetical protein